MVAVFAVSLFLLYIAQATKSTPFLGKIHRKTDRCFLHIHEYGTPCQFRQVLLAYTPVWHPVRPLIGSTTMGVDNGVTWASWGARMGYGVVGIQEVCILTQEATPEVANQEIKKLEQESEQIKVELAEEGTKRDPVSSVKNAEMRSLADTYRFHAELLDEQRGQLQGLKEHNDLLRQRLDELAKEISDWRAFQMQERERIETVKPPIESTPLGNNRKPWGGPGF